MDGAKGHRRIPPPALLLPLTTNPSRLEGDLCRLHSAPAQQLSTFLQGTSILDAKVWRFALQIADRGDILPPGAEPETSSLVRARGEGGIYFVVKSSAEERQERGGQKLHRLPFE